MLTRPPRVLALLATIVLVAGACGGPSATTGPTQGGVASGPPTTQGPTAAPAQTFHVPDFAAADLRWFCCLGGGEDPSQTPTETNHWDTFSGAVSNGCTGSPASDIIRGGATVPRRAKKSCAVAL